MTIPVNYCYTKLSAYKIVAETHVDRFEPRQPRQLKRKEINTLVVKMSLRVASWSQRFGAVDGKNGPQAL